MRTPPPLIAVALLLAGTGCNDPSDRLPDAAMDLWPAPDLRPAADLGPGPDKALPDGGGTGLLGVGSGSTSLTDFPRTGSVTTGDWYVDPKSGSDSNTGKSVGDALATLQAALDRVQDGQRILVRAGTFKPSSRYNRSTDWSKGIEVFNYGDERPLIDASKLGSGSAARVLNLSGSNEHWKGFEVAHSAERLCVVTGHRYTLEDMWFHHGQDSAVYNFGSGSRDNVFVDCAVWRLGDGSSTHTNVPDGFVVTANSGSVSTGHRFVRCFAAHAPDDGFDLFRGANVEVIDCVAFKGGTYWNGNAGGDGGGFKLGGDTGSGNNTIRGSIAIGCKGESIKSNSAPNPVDYYRNTAVSGAYGFTMAPPGGRLRDNIAHDMSNKDYYDTPASDDSHNSWNLGITDPMFAKPAGRDYSLATGSPGIGAGVNGGNLGASEVALAIAKRWCNTNLK